MPKRPTKDLVDEIGEPQEWNDRSKLLLVCRWIDEIPRRLQDSLVAALKLAVDFENGKQVGGPDVLLPAGFSACERGNIYLLNNGCDGGPVYLAYLRCGPMTWLEISVAPGNYPSVNVKTVEMSDSALAAHLNYTCVGWTVLKMNIDGVNLQGDIIVKKK